MLVKLQGIQNILYERVEKHKQLDMKKEQCKTEYFLQVKGLTGKYNILLS